MTHIEDKVIYGGVKGTREAILALRSLRDMLKGEHDGSVSVKWDGAPAIIAGTDPRDGKFFVGTKGVFNKNPTVYKTAADVNASSAPSGLAAKLKDALKYLPELGIKGVIQGDFLYSKSDLSTTTIKGEKYITFHPNTIVYAVPVDSDFGMKIKSSKIGIVWHTTYTGDALQDMKASFGVNIKGLSTPSSVWMDDATYKDVSGKATMTTKETEAVTKSLSGAGKTFQKINSSALTKFLRIQDTFTGNLAGASLKTYYNSKVREGKPINNPKKHAEGYLKWVSNVYDKRIKSLKTEKSQTKVANEQKEMLRELKKHTKNLEQVILFQNYLIEAKMGIVKKLNSVKQLTDTFIRTSNGYKVVNPEGFVAIDRVSGNAVKLVDRMEFSFNNFTAIKAWDR